jgi:hypothetical protein
MLVIVDAVKERTLYLQSLDDLPGRNWEISYQMGSSRSPKFETFSNEENLSTR